MGTAFLAADSLGAAEEALERAATAPIARLRRLALYNLGVARLKRAANPSDPDRERVAEGALAAYRSLLLETPDDADARWNYEVALRLKKRNGSGGGQRDNPQSTPQSQPQSRQPQDDQKQMSRQQAEQLLAAASRDERDTQARRQAGMRQQRPPGGKE
mgnify:FL=1